MPFSSNMTNKPLFAVGLVSFLMFGFYIPFGAAKLTLQKNGRQCAW